MDQQPSGCEDYVRKVLINLRFGYVSVSRASQEATILTNDAARLGTQISADVSKTAALDIARGTALGQEIAMK